MATSEHWAEKYIGLPWLSGGRGPRVFDCWGLLRWVSANDFKRPELPDYPIPPEWKERVREEIKQALTGPEWIRLSRPVDGCAVGLSCNLAFLHHVGIFGEIDGGRIIHADRPQVVAVAPHVMRQNGWARIEFYWHTSWEALRK